MTTDQLRNRCCTANELALSLDRAASERVQIAIRMAGVSVTSPEYKKLDHDMDDARSRYYAIRRRILDHLLECQS